MASPDVMDVINQKLRDRGIAIRPEWITQCVAFLRSDRGPVNLRTAAATSDILFKAVYEQALHSDFNATGLGGIIPPIAPSSEYDMLKGPVVIQVDEVTDVSKNLTDRASDISANGGANPQQQQYQAQPAAPPSSRRCLKFSCTDGIQRIFALEFHPIPSISESTPAGFKLLIKNIEVRRGVLILYPQNVTFLSGFVQTLENARKKKMELLNKAAAGKPIPATDLQQPFFGAVANGNVAPAAPPMAPTDQQQQQPPIVPAPARAVPAPAPAPVQRQQQPQQQERRQAPPIEEDYDELRDEDFEEPDVDWVYDPFADEEPEPVAPSRPAPPPPAAPTPIIPPHAAARPPIVAPTPSPPPPPPPRPPVSIPIDDDDDDAFLMPERQQQKVGDDSSRRSNRNSNISIVSVSSSSSSSSVSSNRTPQTPQMRGAIAYDDEEEEEQKEEEEEEEEADVEIDDVIDLDDYENQQAVGVGEEEEEEEEEEPEFVPEPAEEVDEVRTVRDELEQDDVELTQKEPEDEEVETGDERESNKEEEEEEEEFAYPPPSVSIRKKQKKRSRMIEEDEEDGEERKKEAKDEEAADDGGETIQFQSMSAKRSKRPVISDDEAESEKKKLEEPAGMPAPHPPPSPVLPPVLVAVKEEKKKEAVAARPPPVAGVDEEVPWTTLKQGIAKPLNSTFRIHGCVTSVIPPVRVINSQIIINVVIQDGTHSTGALLHPDVSQAIVEITPQEFEAIITNPQMQGHPVVLKTQRNLMKMEGIMELRILKDGKLLLEAVKPVSSKDSKDLLARVLAKSARK